MERPAFNIPEKQGAGEGAIPGIIPNAFSRQLHAQNRALGQAAFSEFLQDMFAPFKTPRRDRPPHEVNFHWVHLADSSTILISSGVRP